MSDSSLFKAPITNLLSKRAPGNKLAGSSASGDVTSVSAVTTPAQSCKAKFACNESSLTDFSSFKPNGLSSTPLVKPIPLNYEGHMRKGLYSHHKVPSSVLQWNRAQNLLGPGIQSADSTVSSSGFTRPKDPIRQDDVSARLQRNNIAPDTSTMPPPPTPQDSMMRTSAMPTPSSFLGHSRSESVKSWWHGSQSVRSITSNSTRQNTEFCGQVMQRAFDLVLQRCALPPEQNRMAVNLLNQVKGFIDEAAQDVGSTNGSVRSHFSRYASSVKSGFSKVSDKSQAAIKSFFKNGGTSVNVSSSSPMRGVQCSMKRITRRLTTTKAGENVDITVRIVNRTAHSEKRSRSAENISSDPERSAPSTVRRKRLSTSVDNGVVECDSPSEKLFTTNVTVRRGKHENRHRRPHIRVNIRAENDDTPPCAPVEKTQRNKVPKKKPSKKQAKENISVTTVEAVVKVTCTRSGRNVKVPEYYRVEQPKRQPREAQSELPEPAKTTRKRKSDDDATAGQSAEPPKKRPTKRKPAEPPAKAPTPPVVHTRCGRTVRLRVYGKLDDLDSPAALTAGKPLQENVNKQLGRGRAKKVAEKIPIVPLKRLPASLDHDFSFDAGDFYVPEVTKSTRRGAARVKGLENLGAETPPLHHFTSHLNPKLVSSTTPSQQTPDWHLSQRTQSEVKELQKRKVPKKGQKLLKPAIEKLTTKETKKEQAEILKLAHGERPRVSPGADIFARPPFGCSDDSDDADM